VLVVVVDFGAVVVCANAVLGVIWFWKDAIIRKATIIITNPEISLFLIKDYF
jgi:hypothetical protein